METRESGFAREEVSVTIFKNHDVTRWVEKNFDGVARESVYAALIWVGDNWPEMRDKLGIETERVG